MGETWTVQSETFESYREMWHAHDPMLARGGLTLWFIEEEPGVFVAITGNGPKSEQHAREIVALRAALTERDARVAAMEDACRIAYQYAWNIEQKTGEPFTKMRAVEIKKITMDTLRAATPPDARREETDGDN